MSAQYGFFIDSARCTGCKTCELACKDYKNLTPDVSFRRIYEYAGGDWQEDNGVWQQNVFAYYLSIACNHCEDPACTKVCPSGAMHKRDDGFVVVNEEVCIGCRYCHMACPYGAPQYNAAKGHMTKCDGCYDRVAEGKKPICVESCPLSPRCRPRTSPGRVSRSNRTPTRVRAVIPPAIWPIRRRCKMGNGWHEWPLVLFTVLGQSVAGAIIVSGLGWLSLNNNSEARQRLVRCMFFIWLVMGIGFLASIIHLGSPLRAFNSLTRVGASALSNEIASGALFFAVGGVWWLLTFLGKMPAILAKAWLLLTMLLGCLFVLEMTLVYQINTVPTWYNAYTTAAFFLTMVLCGPLFAALLLRVANVPFNGTVFASMSVLALLASLAVVILQNSELAEIRSSVQQASALLPNYGWLQILRLAFLTLGLGCWICPLARKKNPRIASLLLGLILVLLGEFIGRGLFYGLHMTVGTAIAG